MPMGGGIHRINSWPDWRGPSIEPLFGPTYKGVAVDRALSDAIVKCIIETAAYHLEAIEDFSEPSMPLGAAQDLLKAGHDTVAVMQPGGWKSANVLAHYLEHVEHNAWQ